MFLNLFVSLLCRFAFVEFESAEAAKEALENLNGTEIEGRQIRLEYSQNSGGRDAGGRGGSGRFYFSIFKTFLLLSVCSCRLVN